jgi:hypothetical protein
VGDFVTAAVFTANSQKHRKENAMLGSQDFSERRGSESSYSLALA